VLRIDASWMPSRPPRVVTKPSAWVAQLNLVVDYLFKNVPSQRLSRQAMTRLRNEITGTAVIPENENPDLHLIYPLKQSVIVKE
jgi:hypothetical protein